MDARLLIVDDHASSRAFAPRLLSVDGLDVIAEVTDGAGALRATGADDGVRVSRSGARGFVAKADPSGDTLRRVLRDEERNERRGHPATRPSRRGRPPTSSGPGRAGTGPAGGAAVRGATRPSSPTCVVAGPDLKQTGT